MGEPHSDPYRAASDDYDTGDFHQDRVRGKSDYHAGVRLEQNPYPFGKPPGDAPWHAWRQGWFGAYGKEMWERAERNAEQRDG